jgi:RNA polymerase sigma factor (sigma-70 family)
LRWRRSIDPGCPTVTDDSTDTSVEARASAHVVEAQCTDAADGATLSGNARSSLSKDEIYEHIFDTHWFSVRRHLACSLVDSDEVDDLAAEVFLTAWLKLDPSRPITLGWLLRTANNKLRDHARRSKCWDNAMDALMQELDGAVQLPDPMEFHALRAAVRSLNARERQVVVLTYWDGLSACEVAMVLRTTPNAVWTTLTRARHRLRVLIREENC